MKIHSKLYMNAAELTQNGPITIVAFGDSVTHGALSNGEFDYDCVYWNRLRTKINEIRCYVPINVINAGIGGATAKSSLKRMERQVFAHAPDLIIICFGLNDINEPLEDYLSALSVIFTQCLERRIDTIFMTPNMLNTYVADDTDPLYRDYAAKTAQLQNNGTMDLYVTSATKLARSMGVIVCDCYAKWKELNRTQDTTKMLVNRINHPTRQMHALFSECLFDTIVPNGFAGISVSTSAMYTLTHPVLPGIADELEIIRQVEQDRLNMSG